MLALVLSILVTQHLVDGYGQRTDVIREEATFSQLSLRPIGYVFVGTVPIFHSALAQDVKEERAQVRNRC